MQSERSWSKQATHTPYDSIHVKIHTREIYAAIKRLVIALVLGRDGSMRLTIL
jgi:hypothetical protein